MTHCVVDTEAFISRESESIATLTIVVSNMTAIAPVRRMTASFRKAGSSPSFSRGSLTWRSPASLDPLLSLTRTVQ